MSVEFSLKIEGLGALEKRIHKEGAGLKARAQARFLAIGAMLEREGKIRAPQPGKNPYSKGTLRNSIHFEPVGNFGVRVGPSEFYGKFVEFGTGQRGAASGVTPFGGYSYGTVAGMAAQPFMMPSLVALMPQIQDQIKKLGLEVVYEIAHGS